MIKVAVCGAFGRMGTAIGRMVSEANDMKLVGGVDIRPGSFFNTEVVEAPKIEGFLAAKRPDVLVDFTVASAAVANAKAASKLGIALVIGTTGFTPDQRAEMQKAIEGHAPAVISSNFSVGVNIFWKLIREAATQLPDYDIEVTEAHHRYKKDAPSGTAKTILQILDDAIGEKEKLYGREGIRERGTEIGVHVIRGGDIVGDHMVLFCGNYETIEISHRAYDRAVFASGALRAVRWIMGKKPGVYGMDDVLALKK
jgi:4-hydroxy-tetrahydrodipicolinate reductase